MPQPVAAAPAAAGSDAAFARLAAEVAPELAAAEALMAERLRTEQSALIPQVAGHLIGAGGKRLRPMLTLAAARLCGAEGDAPVKLAAAVEYIHNATLLHDDVVDASARRRGRATANAVFGPKPSVLVGDFLFARAFQLMVETGRLEVLRVLSDAAAVIVEGEVLQLSHERDLSGGEAVYFRVVRGKTAALFEAAARVGALAADAPAARVEALAEYGDALGVAFQLVDDLLDFGGPGVALGKEAGEDLREGKATLPVLLAYAAGSDTERAFWRRVIERRAPQEGDLARALELMRARGALEAARARAAEHAARARAALSALPPGPLTVALEEIADFVLARAR